MLQIAQEFPVTEDEYAELDKKFGKLAHKAAWQLIKKNNRTNHTDEQQDVVQNLRIAMLRAGSYYKRQVYIEDCFDKCEEHVEDEFIGEIVKELKNLWKNKTRHGANRQKYGPHQEEILEKIIKKHVPVTNRPRKDRPLRIDSKFGVYCKAITWNAQKSMGKKITREKSIRAGQVSLSEFDYLGGE